MNNIFEIRKDKLKNKLGEIVPWNYKPLPGEHVFTAFIMGNIPIRVCSNTLTYEEFCEIC